MELFAMNPNFFYKRVFYDIIYFLTLVTLAMTLINPIVVLLPTVFLAVISFVIGIFDCETGYLAVALSVCKNE